MSGCNHGLSDHNSTHASESIAHSELAAPTGLSVELLRAPEFAVITDTQPEFSWVVPTQVVAQKAYHIRVASSLSALQENNADSWDSGLVKSSQNLNIEYAGKPLSEGDTYWWHVYIVDLNDKISDVSAPQSFNLSDQISADTQWPGESLWEMLDSERWVAQNRQTAEFESIAPQIIKNLSDDEYLVDFGKAAFATLNVSISADSDQQVTIYLGERLDTDGRVDKRPTVSSIGFVKLILNVKAGTHSYQTEIPPHQHSSPHTQRLAPFYPEVLPFRFAEIIFPDSTSKLHSVNQAALFYPFDDEASAFSSDNDNLNKVWELSKYTLKATPFLGLYSDGNRERMPYEADSYIQQLGHYSVDREYSVARYTNTFMLHHASWPTEWNLQMVMMAWQDYMYTANADFLHAYYEQLKVKTLYELARKDGLISTRTGKVTQDLLDRLHYNGDKFRDIVDWPKGTAEGEQQYNNAGPTPEGERDGYVFTDINTVVNAYHYNVLNIMSEIAKVVGNDADAARFASQADKVQSAVMQHLFDKERGVFVDGIGTEHASLHANMFPLAFDLVPDQHIDSVVNYIQSKGMASSVYGAQHLLDGLYKAGASEYALSLMLEDGKRGWLNMIRVGSTMTTEAWDEYYKPNLTWNHAWGSAPANIIPRRLMGITPIQPGFEHFEIVPQPSSLRDIRLRTPTIRGSIETHLKVDDKTNTWVLEVSVPGNTQADVWLPANMSDVSVNGEKRQNLEQANKANQLRTKVTLGAGTHKLVASR